MVNRIYGGGYNLSDAVIRQTENLKSTERTTAQTKKTDQEQSFRELLEQQRISFSKHANRRTEERSIKISQADLNRLGEAFNKAEAKGIEDALIVMDDSAFIVNAKNKVVITVMDKSEMKDNVFTNIDGAIFI
ncbi:MAG: TIGR02530 family flagellar biosynthesis protein [Bacillota bacterium]|jgi:flagellar operon protein|nr:TIGR02530 family flagellar biosynthesis protein [Bacillota bacterium]